MRKHSRALLTAASLATVSLVAACMGTSDGDTTEESTGDDVELRMTIWSAAPEHVEMFQSLGDEFAEASPRVSSVTIESFNLADLDTLFTTQIAAGDPPDVSWLPVESSREYVSAGALVDLREAIDATPDFDFDDFVPSLLENWVDGEAVYGIPFSTGPLIMYFNKDLYAEAGVKDPEQLIAEGNWTWDAFRETSQQLSDELGLPGYALNDFDFQNWTRLLPYMEAYGASPWNDDATACTMDSPEMVDAMSMFHGMTFDDGSMPVPGRQVDFWGGQVGATSAFLGSSGNLSEVEFEWGIAPTPGGPAGDVVATGQASIVALSAGNHTTESAEFVTFLATKDAMAEYSGAFPPIRESLLVPETFVENSDVLTTEAVQPIIDGITANGQVFPVAQDNSAVADALNSSLDLNLYQPDADVQEAMISVCADIAPLLG
ncbi:ABC transporter substrate-binding protein [Ruania albidiflava]|uniref:ABC transporter substrate-binding protein n=1 Tax=Ruania albidiflava TaxID=366586 RepID=UPI0003B7AE7C|nr:sugar ABC transporter substrate-binding protein [Ruania albidiflava]